MRKTSTVRTASAEMVVGAAMALGTLGFVAPASANVPAACPAVTTDYLGTAPACSVGTQNSIVPAANGASASSDPNSAAVAQNALTGAGTSNSINTGQPGNSSGPNTALIAGGVALVLVALGGGVFVVRRRTKS